MKKAKKGEIIILLAILLLFVLLRLPTLYEPFGRDQGIFATIASGLLEGKIPYRDLWDHKPPGIYFLYALVFKLLGKEMRSIALFDGLYTIFTISLLFTLARELFDRRTAYLAILLFTMLSSGIFFLGWWGRGQPEVFMLLPLVGMIYSLRPVESREKEVFPVLLAGITGGIAFSLKSTIVPLLLLICLTLGLEGWLDSKQIRKGIVRMLLFSLGVIIILTPFFIFFLVNGALEDLFFANVTFNLATHINHPLTIGFVRNFINKIYLIGTRIPLLWVTILVLALYGIVRIGNVEKKKRLILVMWISGILLSIGFGWWLFLYHFIVLIPPLTLLASFGFFQLLDRLSSQRRTIHQISRRLILYLLIPFLLIEFLSFYIHAYCDTGIIPSLIGTEKINREELYSRFKVQELPINDFSFSDDYRLSRYLQNHTHEKEKIFVWGWESLVYFLSEREPASRYIFIYPLIQNNLDLRRGAQKIFWEELNEKKPRYFIVAKKDQNPIDEIGSEKRLSLFPELRHFLQGQYLKENETGRFVIYRRVK